MIVNLRILRISDEVARSFLNLFHDVICLLGLEAVRVKLKDCDEHTFHKLALVKARSSYSLYEKIKNKYIILRKY